MVGWGVEGAVGWRGGREWGGGQDGVDSKAIGFRITDDMRIGYRTIRYTGA
eukprot:COSAG01_NODE_68872_length_263_cov_0.530488_1_plen_50_part_10